VAYVTNINGLPGGTEEEVGRTDLEIIFGHGILG
jgi:hypothetical protein